SSPSIISKLRWPMMTAPQSLSESPMISCRRSHASENHANTSVTSSFLPAMYPSSETERPNMTLPIVCSYHGRGCYPFVRVLGAIWLIAQRDDTALERPRLQQLQRKCAGDASKEGFALTQHRRIDVDAVLVDQV